MNIKLLVAMMVAAAASGCATLGNQGADVNPAVKSTVVTQAGSKNPVVAGKDRSYWLEMRQKKDLRARTIGSMATGESEAAVTFAKAQLAKNPGNPDALNQLAASLALVKNYDLAAYYANLADKVRPGNAETLNIRGLAAMLTPSARMQDFRNATVYFQQAMDADPKQIAAGLNLGNLYLELGNSAAAEGVFSQVVSRCGECSAGLLGLGVAQRRTGKFDAALASFQKILKKNANHGAALFNVALVYHHGLNNRKEAESALNRLLASKHITDFSIRKRAHLALRRIKGEADVNERMADAPSSSDSSDAELLMSSSEFED